MKNFGLKITTILASACLSVSLSYAAGGGNVHLEPVHNDLHNKASLQRGAALFVNYCAGCHTLQHVRYNQLGEYLGIEPSQTLSPEDRAAEKQTYEDLIQNNLNFVSDKVIDPMTNAMHSKDAAAWFGNPPPDLTLVTRVRGKDWVYSYLKSFYKDTSRPWGVNNLVFPDVGMPHALLNLQGLQTPVYETQVVEENGQPIEKKVIVDLQLAEPGKLEPEAYDQAMTDLVNFLAYVAEPVKLKRENLGVFILLFLVVLITLTYLLKREFWKDVH